MSLCQITLDKLCRLIFIGGGGLDVDEDEEQEDGSKLDLRVAGVANPLMIIIIVLVKV